MSWIESGRGFVKEVRVEFDKVSWPTRKELQSHTGVVIVAVIIISVFIGIIDRILNAVLKLIIR